MIKENEPMADYLASDYIGSSQLKEILKSPKDYYFSLKQKSAESSSQKNGTLIHKYILEREEYKKDYIIQPECWGPLNKKPGSTKWNEFKKQAKEAGKIPVSFKESGSLLLVDEVIENHEPLKQILATHKPEVSFYGEYNGVKIKSREDLWCAEDGTVYDVKSSAKMFKRDDESLDESLGRIVYDHGYHFSAIHHIMAMKAAGVIVKSWGWIFVSTATPCPHIVIRKASTDMLSLAFGEWKKAINLLKKCQENDKWDSYIDDEINVIDFPDWIQNKF